MFAATPMVRSLDEERRSPEILAAAAALTGEAENIGRAISERIAAAMPGAHEDSEEQTLLEGSVISAVATFLYMLRNELSVDQIDLPLDTLEYGRMFARRGRSFELVLQAYRWAHDAFWNDWLAPAVDREVTDRSRLLPILAACSRATFEYVDRVTARVMPEYEREREQALRGKLAARSTLTAAILRGDVSDLEGASATLRYRLSGTHRAFVCWTGSAYDGDRLSLLDAAARGIADALGADRPLLIPADTGAMWGWVRCDDAPPPSPCADDVGSVLSAAVHVALGEPGIDVAGFRRTHQQALRTQRLVITAKTPAPSVTAYSNVSMISLLAGELEAARAFVQEELGALTQLTTANDRLRRTLREFLRHERSYLRTAEAMGIHRNTVRYRIDRAASMLPRTLQDRRLELEAALALADELGEGVLEAGTRD